PPRTHAVAGAHRPHPALHPIPERGRSAQRGAPLLAAPALHRRHPRGPRGRHVELRRQDAQAWRVTLTPEERNARRGERFRDVEPDTTASARSTDRLAV